MKSKAIKFLIILSLLIPARIVFSQKTVRHGIETPPVPSSPRICVGEVVVLGGHGSLAAWGINNLGQYNVPPGNNFIAVAGGNSHSLALRSDGSLAAWGYNYYGQCNVPPGNNFIAVAGVSFHNLALRSDGSLAAWGRNDYGQCVVPAGNDFIAVAGGYSHSLALRSDGTLAAWGYNGSGQCNVPPGNDFIAMAGGSLHSLALRSDGTLAAWGDNVSGQCNVPSGNDFIAVAGGLYHSLAIRQKWTVDAWVNGGGGSVNPASQDVNPGENVSIQIAPDTGWSVLSITDNGVEQAIASPYPIQNVREDHQVAVNFFNSPPEIHITSPANEADVFGSVTVSAEATDNTKVTRTDFYLDGQALKPFTGEGPYSFVWDTSPVSPGWHTIRAVARDETGLTSYDEVRVNVSNLKLLLQAERKREQGLMLRLQYGEITVTIDNPDNVEVAKCELQRQESGGSFSTIREISMADFQNNTFTYFDKYLKGDKKYTYRIQALDGGGKVLTVSNQETI